MSQPTKNPATETKVLIKNVTLSYVHVLRPFAGDNGGEAKYSCVIIIPKTDTATIGALKVAIKAAYDKGTSEKWQGKAPALSSIHQPVRDGDNERPDDEVFKGCYFMNASSKMRPGVIDINRRDLAEPGLEEEVYSGMKAHVSVNFFAYDAKGNRGIACGLNNICKCGDGTFLGGRTSAESDFDSLLGSEKNKVGDTPDDDFLL